MRQIVAILRGVHPDEVEAIGRALVDAGITKIEVPLNSPQPLVSIEKLAKSIGSEALVGAGTVLSVDDVAAVRDAGGQLVVSPDCNTDVIRATRAAGMQSFPGVMTPTEAFAALHAGANGLKIFPAVLVGPVGLSAMRAVLPADAIVLAVGGAGPENFDTWRQAGADGFGIGTALYKPGDSAATVKQKAETIVAAFDKHYAQ